MSTPPSGFDDQPVLVDVDEHGDALDDPEYRDLLGL